MHAALRRALGTTVWLWLWVGVSVTVTVVKSLSVDAVRVCSTVNSAVSVETVVVQLVVASSVPTTVM